MNDAQYLDRAISEEELIWPCDQCELRFAAKKFLDDHSSVHKSKMNQSCRLCYKTFSDTRAVTKHEKVRHVKEAEYLQRDILHSELVHICTGCNKRFVTENLLKSHKKRHELDKYEPLRREAYDKSTKRNNCKFCYRTYHSFADFVAHIELAHKSDLHRIHEKIITADLSFSCNSCDLTFISNDVLTYHKSRSHTEIKARTEQCSHCPEAFKYHNTLRKHSLSVHKTRLLSKVLNCKLCEKPIRGRKNLKVHTKNMHTSPEEVNALTLDKIKEEDLKFLCKYCDKKFLTEDVLKHHKNCCQKAPRNQSQKCKNCPDLFSSFGSLMKHSSEVHNIKIFYKHSIEIIKCKLCDKPLKGKGNLRSHEKSLHTTAEEIEALKGDKIGEQLLSVQCLSCGKRFLNERTLKCHNSFCNTAAKAGKYSNIYGGKKDCMLCLVNFGTTLEFANHFHSIHRKFDEEISALKSLQIGQQISLQSRCKFCQKKLLNGHVLKSHYEKVHRTEESKKTWECEFCKKEFKPEKKRRSTVGVHMRDEHDLPEYNCLEGTLVVGGSSTKKTGGVGNQAKQNFQLMLAKMLGKKT